MATKKTNSTKSRKSAVPAKTEPQVILTGGEIHRLLQQLQSAIGHVIDLRTPNRLRHELGASPFELALSLLRNAHYGIERRARLSNEVAL